MPVSSIMDKVPRRAVMVRGKAALSFSIQIDAVQAAVGWGRERILVVLDVFLFEIRMWRMCVSLSLRLQKMYKFVIIHFLRGGRCAPPQTPPSIWRFQGQDDSRFQYLFIEKRMSLKYIFPNFVENVGLSVRRFPYHAYADGHDAVTYTTDRFHRPVFWKVRLQVCSSPEYIQGINNSCEIINDI